MSAGATFSVSDRERMLQQLRTERFDLLIVGGGITGAGIALDAVSRGLKTALLERQDFAFGTSGRSTKLIHGGLRYLKQLEFGLVREVGRERAIVHHQAPHLVVPEKMLLPLSGRKGMGYWLTSFGLWLYDLLAGVKREDARRMLTREQVLKQEPLLDPGRVNGGAIYAEYRTDDARLTLEVIKTAVQQGACILNHVAVNDFIYNGNVISGAGVTDRLTNEAFIVETTAVVNAGGPWVDQLRDRDRSLSGKRLHLTKGVHIVVPHSRLPVGQTIYFDAGDGRMIFAIPRWRTTYVGTTDTTYQGDPDHATATREDVHYLLHAVNAAFPSVHLEGKDIESSWAGLRPLIHEEGKASSELSRKDEIFESPTGLISIAGGKLTGYRKMAQRTVDLVIRKHFARRSLKPCRTARLRLTGAGFRRPREVSAYRSDVEKELAALGLERQYAAVLVESFGTQVDRILELYRGQDRTSPPDLRLLMAQCDFCVQYEMVASLEDFCVRRTGLLYFDISRVKAWKEAIAARLATRLGWDEGKYQSELRGIDDLIRSATEYPAEVEGAGP